MTSKRIRLIAVTAAAFGIAVGGAAMPASAAVAQRAAASCSGSLIEQVPVSGGKAIGTLAVYYNSSTGQNCARLNHGSKTWGKKHTTDVYLARCRQTRPGRRCDVANSVRDKGAYAYYAGPVRLKAAKNCIFAYGYVTYNGKTHAAVTYPAASHCG